jgi:hypothetical protein
MQALLVDAQLITIIINSLQQLRYHDGLYQMADDKGIMPGSPLSPLLGAIALIPLDQAYRGLDVFYLRYMDDYVIFTNKRSRLRNAIKLMYGVLKKLKLVIAKDKTFIGKNSTGFDFLAYYFSPELFTISLKTYLKHLAKLNQLYEQGTSDTGIIKYQERFMRWCNSGLSGISHLSLDGIKVIAMHHLSLTQEKILGSLKTGDLIRCWCRPLAW